MAITFNPGSRMQSQHVDVLSSGALYLPESDGTLTLVTATPSDLNAVGEHPLVCNKSGSPMTVGQLVYISGYDATLGAPIVTLADADFPSKKAQFVLPAAIADGATGYAEATYVITGLNTNAASAVNDPVYLSATVGGWVLVAPTGDRTLQQVGVVKVKSATVGEIYFFPGESFVEKIGTSGLQDAAVTADKLAAAVAGDGLAGGAGSALSLDLNELTGATMAVSADSVPFLDATGNVTRIEAVADMVGFMAGTAATSGLAATSGVMAVAPTTTAATIGADSVVYMTAAGVPHKDTFSNLAGYMAGAGLTASGGVISLNDAGSIAVGSVIFGATGDCTSVTVNGVAYAYDVAPNVADGEWTYGASASESATNLAAAINGLTGSLYAATANTDTVHIYAKSVGAAGNVVVARVGGAQPATTANLVGGVDAGNKKHGMYRYTVKAADTDTAVLVNIPLPFAPVAYTSMVQASTGVYRYDVTDAFTIGTVPNRIVITGAGGTHLVTGDVVTVYCHE